MRKVGIFIGIGLIFITFGFSPLVTVAAALDSTSAIGVLPIDTSNFLAAGLVTCNGPDCTFCSLMAMINGIIAWLVGIAMVIATISLAIAGFKLVYSQGNATAVTDTKGIIFNIIIGIILIISAWFMIDTLMKLAAGDKFSHWWEPFNEENCGKMFEASTDLKREIVLTEHEVSGLDYGPDGYLGGMPDGTGPVGGSISGVPYGLGDTLMLAGGGSTTVLPCSTSDLRTISFMGHQAKVHKNLTASLQRIDARWRSLGGNSYYEVRSVGSYNCRKVTNGESYSNHAYGLAIDINADTNGYYEGATGPIQDYMTDMNEQSPLFYSLFTAEGWGWGGNWNSLKDAMHYSKARGEQGDMRGE